MISHSHQIFKEVIHMGKINLEIHTAEEVLRSALVNKNWTRN